jgi:hypothetical protein
MITDFVNVPRMVSLESLPELIDTKQLLGVELEVEYRDGNRIDGGRYVEDFWRNESDGSIMEGREWVLRRPMCGDELRRAVYEIYNGSNVGDYYTTGTHIHVNMVEANTTFLSIKKLVMLMYLMEEYIYACQAKGRDSSAFCHPMQSYGAHKLATLLKVREDDSDAYYDVRQSVLDYNESCKYMGLNLSPLNRYGTVEFRYFTTATSATELITYINICIACKKAIKTYDELLELTQDEQSWNAFLDENFPLWASEWKEAVSFDTIKYKFKSVVVANASASVPEQLTFKLPRGATKFYKKRAIPKEPAPAEQLNVLSTVPHDTSYSEDQSSSARRMGEYLGFSFYVTESADVPSGWSAYRIVSDENYLAVNTSRGFPTINQLSTIASMATVL